MINILYRNVSYILRILVPNFAAMKYSLLVGVHSCTLLNCFIKRGFNTRIWFCIAIKFTTRTLISEIADEMRIILVISQNIPPTISS